MTTFEDLGLSQKVTSAVADAGYTTPTPIQAGAIPPALQRRDILGIAQTGTGKTASFVLPMLTLLEKGRARARMPRTLILEPTRELAAQVAENFEKYGKNHKLTVALLIGGVSFDDQNRKLERGADVLIATPGRLLDHCERGKLLMTGVEILVIDEADRMLDMGFIPDIERIAKMIPFTRQTLFFSATMPPEIQKLADTFLQNPERIEVAKPSSTATTVTQRLVASHAIDWEKRAVLRDLLREVEADIKNAIIFCNRKKDVADLFRSLERHGFEVGALHGDMDQRSRTTMLQNFRDGNLKILVASDVAARGLDIPDVSHVFNFDVPIHAEDYVHRIGRTGRAGRLGSTFMIVTKKDSKHLDAIEKLTGQSIGWHNGDLTNLPAREEKEDTSSGRRDSRSKDRRGGKDRNGGRKEAAAGHNPVTESADTVAAVNKDTNGAKDTMGKNNTAKKDYGHQDRPRPANDDRRRRYNNQDDGPTPVGFGDDIPAFMLTSAAIGIK
ncbi:DEAD/DEAH box helicase [Rhizobium alvei]|uniref:DEAD/DEAH box helicase n=1 Tax=Rhizobium alvei TaxID=1132659 RepID=A0ABT8YHP4_9HYPH|nr:DEAD/DEAH box helicase [Rhizobium alvei]MDO6963161.1 DEAD/DEAH box helicase [Rhizobium alvei]